MNLLSHLLFRSAGPRKPGTLTREWFFDPGNPTGFEVRLDGSVGRPAQVSKKWTRYPADVPADLIKALDARGDAAAGNDSAIDRFASRVLVLRQGGRWREAVSTALLSDWIAPALDGRALDITAVQSIRAEAQDIHRQLTPIWRRRANRSRVLLLDTPLGNDVTLHDLIAESSVAEAIMDGTFETDNPRLISLLKALDSKEKAVVLAWTHRGVATWVDAAAVAGANDPQATGERVRRKIRRLVAEQDRRHAARTNTKRCLPDREGKQE